MMPIKDSLSTTPTPTPAPRDTMSISSAMSFSSLVTRRTKNGIIGSDVSVDSIPQLLSERIRQIEEREREVSRREDALRAAMGNPSDVLHLNVGGRTDIAVLRRTLTSVEGSMLANRFSGKWDKDLEKDRHGNFFVDQDPTLFLELVNFLRDRTNHTTKSLPSVSPKPTTAFARLVEYYGVTLAVYPIKITAAALKPGTLPDSCEVQDFPRLAVTTTAFHTFDLKNVGHEREVKYFDVVLGSCTQLQIGWRSPDASIDTKRNGLGEEEGSVALDAMNHVMLCDGEGKNLRNLDVREGTRIRCVRNAKYDSWSWIITDDQGVRQKKTSSNKKYSLPCFSLIGSLHITDVVYGKF